MDDTITVVNNIPAMSFKNKNLQNTMTRKLSVILENIDTDNYAEAYDKLLNDVLKKTDGCAENGTPDKNDWIKSCTEQAQVYPLIIEALGLLANLI